MLHFPLLSDAYAVALFGADGPRTEPVPHDGGDAGTFGPPRRETPGGRLDDEGGEEHDDTATPERDDIETARTRPLRLDQIHL